MEFNRHSSKDQKSSRQRSKRIFFFAKICLYIWHIFRHDLFLKAHTFARASLSQNFLRLSTEDICGKISFRVFTPNRGYCLYGKWHHRISYKVVFGLAREELIGKEKLMESTS